MIFNMLQLWDYKVPSRKQAFLMKRQLSSQIIAPYISPYQPPRTSPPPCQDLWQHCKLALITYRNEFTHTISSLFSSSILMTLLSVIKLVKHYLPLWSFTPYPQDKPKGHLSAWAQKLKVITLLRNKSQYYSTPPLTSLISPCFTED